MTTRHGILIAFFVACGVMAYHDLKDCHAMPWPPRFVSAGIAYGMLGLFAVVSEELAAVVAIGITIATLVNKGFVGDCKTKSGTATVADFTSLEGAGQPPSYGTFDSSQVPPGSQLM